MSAVWFKRLNIHKAHEKPFLNDFGANIRKSAIHWWSISETRSPLSPWEENEGVSWQPIAWTPFAILQASDFVFLEGQCDLLMLPGFAHPTSVSMLPQNKHIGIVSAHSLRWQVSFQEKCSLRKWKYSFFYENDHAIHYRHNFNLKLWVFLQPFPKFILLCSTFEYKYLKYFHFRILQRTKSFVGYSLGFGCVAFALPAGFQIAI